MKPRRRCCPDRQSARLAGGNGRISVWPPGSNAAACCCVSPARGSRKGGDDLLLPVTAARRRAHALGGVMTWDTGTALAGFDGRQSLRRPHRARGRGHGQPPGAGRADSLDLAREDLGPVGRRHAAGDGRSSRRPGLGPCWSTPRPTFEMVQSAALRAFRRNAAAPVATIGSQGVRSCEGQRDQPGSWGRCSIARRFTAMLSAPPPPPPSANCIQRSPCNDFAGDSAQLTASAGLLRRRPAAARSQSGLQPSRPCHSSTLPPGRQR